jgi:calcium binding protein
VAALSKAELAAMAEEATVDAYGDDEQAMGFHTMIADNLEMPFATSVLGVDVTVEDIGLGEDNSIVAICARDRIRQAIRVVDLPLPEPPPAGAEWIEAYRHWLG